MNVKWVQNECKKNVKWVQNECKMRAKWVKNQSWGAWLQSEFGGIRTSVSLWI